MKALQLKQCLEAPQQNLVGTRAIVVPRVICALVNTQGVLLCSLLGLLHPWSLVPHSYIASVPSFIGVF